MQRLPNGRRTALMLKHSFGHGSCKQQSRYDNVSIRRATSLPARHGKAALGKSSRAARFQRQLAQTTEERRQQKAQTRKCRDAAHCRARLTQIISTFLSAADLG
eukprot:2168550-Pleurochrysis_carterae.AAC.1